MKTIGMIGGTSWESTQLYYQQLNERTAQALGGLHSARCILYSLEFGEVYAHMERGDWDAAAEITRQYHLLKEKINRLYSEWEALESEE